jgi:NADH-quinone oxidoreductase subunit J
MDSVSYQWMLFGLFALGAVTTALFTITRKNPVSAAMSLVAHFVMLSGLYLTLEAQFVAAVQVLVYAGAIMVLVVFVIMLLNVGNEEQLQEKPRLRTIMGSLFGALFALQVIVILLNKPTGARVLHKNAIAIGTTESIGNSLFTTYLFPFEAVSLLLLAALIGSVVLAKRHVKES